MVVKEAKGFSCLLCSLMSADTARKLGWLADCSSMKVTLSDVVKKAPAASMRCHVRGRPHHRPARHTTQPLLLLQFFCLMRIVRLRIATIYVSRLLCHTLALSRPKSAL
jgi:hypothetical protein